MFAQIAASQGHTLRFIRSIQEVDPIEWDTCAGPHPFVQHAYLLALEKSASVGLKRGVVPLYLLLCDPDGQLIACAPSALKWGTSREYGPEILWLRAGLEQGSFGWPKFQLGVPFFPTQGPRILINPKFNRPKVTDSLITILKKLGPRLGAPDAFNVMHIDAATAHRLHNLGALVSWEYQSFWYNPGYTDLGDYLNTLNNDKRAKFRKERREAEAHGLRYKVLHGTQITPDLITAYYLGHEQVCRRHGHEPWLPEKFYQEIVRTMVQYTCLLGYFNKDDQLVAGILGLISPSEQILYLLQWSEVVKYQGVALDLICLRPIDYAIEHGIKKVDSGLAANHKTLRGWQQEKVYHAHWFNNSDLEELAHGVLNKEPPAVQMTLHALPETLAAANRLTSV